MYKIGIISFLIIFCTYLVISSTAPNQSEIDSKSLALNNSNGQVSYWFDLETIHDYTLKCYRYIQYYCVLIFTEGQYQLAWDGLFEDLFNFVQTVENFVRDIDLSALKKNLTDFIKRIELTDFHLRLIREFTLILAGNAFLVWVAWKIYGPRISAKFGHTKGRKTVEELRVSMSEFALPKEHDFKFK